jgi:hypothetical protein
MKGIQREVVKYKLNIKSGSKIGEAMCSHPKLACLIRPVRPVGPTGQTGVVKVHKLLFGLHHWIGLVE